LQPEAKVKRQLTTTLLVTALFVGTGAPGIAFAQSDVFDQFFRYAEVSHSVSYPGVPEESVDPFSGTLHILQTDIVLPGKGGFDLRLVRSYSSRIWGRTDDASLASLIAETDRSPLGYGWSFHMGRLKNPNATGQPTGPCSDDYPLLEMPDGSARVFYRAPALGTKVYLSRDFWRMEADCSFLGGGGKGTCIWSTDGVRHEFSSAVANSFFTNAATLVWPASAHVDQFGNAITIIYNQDRTGNINRIIDTYGRNILFDYQGTVGVGDGTRLSRILVGTSTYTYNHTAYSTIAGGTRRFLTSVQPPVGPSYVYTYATTATVRNNQYALQSMTYPNGAVVGYVYGSTAFNAYVGPAINFAVLQTKSLLDRGGSSLGTWTYSYSSPGNGGGSNVTTILRPDGKYDIFNIFGFGATGPGTFWKVGLLDQGGRGCSSTSLSSCLERLVLGISKAHLQCRARSIRPRGMRSAQAQRLRWTPPSMHQLSRRVPASATGRRTRPPSRTGMRMDSRRRRSRVVSSPARPR
jgi:hypothetical protein